MTYRDHERDQEWLDRAVEAFDLLFFDGSIAEKKVRAKWHRFRSRGQRTRYADYLPPSPRARPHLRHPVIRVNVVLAEVWVPRFFVLDTIYHELLHAELGPDHGVAFRLAEDRYIHHTKAALWEAASVGAFLEAARS